MAASSRPLLRALRLAESHRKTERDRPAIQNRAPRQRAPWPADARLRLGHAPASFASLVATATIGPPNSATTASPLPLLSLGVICASFLFSREATRDVPEKMPDTSSLVLSLNGSPPDALPSQKSKPVPFAERILSARRSSEPDDQLRTSNKQQPHSTSRQSRGAAV